MGKESLVEIMLSRSDAKVTVTLLVLLLVTPTSLSLLSNVVMASPSSGCGSGGGCDGPVGGCGSGGSGGCGSGSGGCGSLAVGIRGACVSTSDLRLPLDDITNVQSSLDAFDSDEYGANVCELTSSSENIVGVWTVYGTSEVRGLDERVNPLTDSCDCPGYGCPRNGCNCNGVLEPCKSKGCGGWGCNDDVCEKVCSKRTTGPVHCGGKLPCDCGGWGCTIYCDCPDICDHSEYWPCDGKIPCDCGGDNCVGVCPDICQDSTKWPCGGDTSCTCGGKVCSSVCGESYCPRAGDPCGGDQEKCDALPEFPLGFAMQIALIPVIIYVWRKSKHKPKSDEKKNKSSLPNCYQPLW